MTANRARRRRSMWIGLAGGVVSLMAAGALTMAAVSALADSTAGRSVSSDDSPPVRELPWTATALIGLVDDAGELTTSAVAVLTPSGRGGAILPVSTSADAAAGNGRVVRPLGAVFAVDGPEAWRAATEQLTGVSVDVAEVLDHERFEELFAPLGTVPVAFPFEFTDASGTTFEAGETLLTTSQLSAVLSADAGAGPAWELDLARDAAWSAIADRVGAGIGSLPEGVRIDRELVPQTLDDYLDALFAAPVEFRSLTTEQIDPERVATELPLTYADEIGDGWEDAVVTHRRSELLLMFASIAPARMGAPADGPTVRLVSGFTSDDALAVGAERSDVLMTAIDRLAFGQANVVSVVDSPGAGVPDLTRVLVGDDDLTDAVWETYDGVFGEMQVVAAAEPILGVDIEIMLGREFLGTLDETSEDDASEDDAPDDDAPDDDADVAGSDS